MSVDEVRMRLRRKLEELVGVSEAEILLDRPPGGWGDLVTNHTLDLRFEAFEARMDAKMDGRFGELDARLAEVDSRFVSLEQGMHEGFIRLGSELTAFKHEMRVDMERGFRDQAWKVLSAIIASMGVAVGIAIAAIRL